MSVSTVPQATVMYLAEEEARQRVLEAHERPLHEVFSLDLIKCIKAVSSMGNPELNS
jgi:hypothetical protein